jgi:uncharacterized protein (DUF433 family)
MDWREHIHSDPAILGGKPVIRGSRISVELVLERLTDGWSEEMLLASYPHLSPDQVRAAIAFALDMITEEAGIARARAA